MKTFLDEFGLVGSAGQSPVTFPCSFYVSTQATQSLLRGEAGGPSVTDAPGTPDLLAASDSGSSDTDNITNVTTPVFRVGLPAQAVIADTVRVYRAGSTEIGSELLDGADIGNGYVDVMVSALTSGGHTITARVENGSGLSPASGGLGITVDTVAPDAPGAVDLAAASDSGASDTDDITNVNTPVIDITLPANAVAGDLLELREGTTVLSSKTLDSADITAGVVSLTSSSLSDGGHTLDARVTDVAGNVGADSSGLSITIDTAAPSAPTAIIVTPADQGSRTTQTENTQPTFRISLPGDAVASDVVTLEIDTVDDATATLDGTDISNGYVDIQSANVLADDALYDISAFITDVAGNAGASNTAVEVEVGTVANAIPAVIYDGVGDYLLHTGGPAGVSDGAALTVVWAGTFNSDGSAMTLLDIAGTVPVQLVRQSDNTIDFIGGTAGAVFSNSTSAVAASLGFLIVLASCNGTSSTLKVVHAGGTITGSPTAGSAATLDLTADWYLGSDGGSGSFLDGNTAMWWLDDAEIDFTDADNIEEFWDTTNDLLRDPGADGSNPSGAQPLVCHVDPSATHTVNRGSGGDADGGANSGDGTSPGSYAEDYGNQLPAVSFDGSNNYLGAHSLNGSDTAFGVISFWFRRNSTSVTQHVIGDSQNLFRVRLYFNSSDFLRLRLHGQASGQRFDDAQISDDAIVDGNWHHILISWNGNNLTTGEIECAIDGVLQTVGNGQADGTIDLNLGSLIGANNASSPNGLFDGDMAQLYMMFSHGVYFDITSSANLNRFYDTTNDAPRDLASDGTGPGLGSPDIYMNTDAASWGTNAGTDGNWTQNGTFTDAGSSPGAPNPQP